jgi:uncharacterized protein YecE (DUF72 family)
MLVTRIEENILANFTENTRPLVGVGGWAYLPIKRNKLEVCSKLYDFVELNSSFYEIPKTELVQKWRKSVPNSFEFTVRANRELTHEGKLEPTRRNFAIYDHLTEICNNLNSEILHFQFPPSIKVTKAIVARWRDFFGSVSRRTNTLHYAIEPRGQVLASSDFEDLLYRFDLVLTSDISRVEAISSPKSKIMYSRIFGLGDHTKWSFDTDELQNVARKLSRAPAGKKYVTFHNLTMYEDASRARSIINTGTDQAVSANAPKGLVSLSRSISTGKLVYPASKQDLIREFGWKTFDLQAYRKEHVAKYLEMLPDGNREYSSPESVLETLKSDPRISGINRE